MTITLCTLLFILAICIYQFIAYRRMYTYVSSRFDQVSRDYAPYAAVILPCKGLDPDFENNLHKLMAQEYGSNEVGKPDFEIIFAVAKEDDPAYAVIDKVIKQYPAVNARLIIAGISNKRAQKITNQLEALKQISDKCEVFVFVDSDVIARKDFLSQLIAPLQDKMIGIATGYRFYLPSKFSVAALMRSLWNRLSAWELSSKKFSFAWGGAMAIRKEVFEQARVSRAWECSADDDLAMTTAVKKVGLSVAFVPQCLVISEGQADWPEVIEWTNRQLILTKVYYPALWAMGIIRATVMGGWLIVMLALLFQIIVFQVYKLLPVFLAGSMLLAVEVFFLIQAHSMWRKLLLKNAEDGQTGSQFAKTYEKLLWYSILVIPVAHVILPALTLYSLLTNRIRWRGINYELRGPSETVII